MAGEGLAIGSVAFNPLYTEMGYIHRHAALIGKACTPTIPVKTIGGNYPTWEQGSFHKLHDTVLAIGESARRSSFTLNLDSTFTCKLHKWACEIPLMLKMISETGIDLGLAATWTAKDAVDLQREYNFATLYTTTSWSSSMDMSTSDYVQWNHEVEADILRDGITAKEAIRQATYGSKLANFAIIPQQIWNEVILNDRVRAVLVGGGEMGPREVTAERLARFWGLDEIYIPGAMYNASDSGVADASTTKTNMWGNYVFFGHRSTGRSIYEASCAVNLEFSYKARSWYEDSPDQDVVEWQEVATQVALATDCGCLLSNVLDGV